MIYIDGNPINKQYVRVNNVDYIVDYVSGRMSDYEWDGRESKIIKFYSTTYNDVLALMINNVSWSIIDHVKDEDSGEITESIEQCDDFCISGDITDHRDGSVSIKMGKLTELEEAYQMLLGE